MKLTITFDSQVQRCKDLQADWFKNVDEYIPAEVKALDPNWGRADGFSQTENAIYLNNISNEIIPPKTYDIFHKAGLGEKSHRHFDE